MYISCLLLCIVSRCCNTACHAVFDVVVVMLYYCDVVCNKNDMSNMCLFFFVCMCV